MTTLELDLPTAIYRLLEKQPPQIQQAAMQVAVEAIGDYLASEAKRAAGRDMLLRLSEEAHQYDDLPPRDLAARHNAYVYGEQ